MIPKFLQPERVPFASIEIVRADPDPGLTALRDLRARNQRETARRSAVQCVADHISFMEALTLNLGRPVSDETRIKQAQAIVAAVLALAGGR